MKRLLLIVLPLLLIVGCSKPVEDSTLINKDGLMYLPDSDSPYSGEVFTNYDTGEKEYQGTYENGLLIEYSYLNKDGTVKEPVNGETLIDRGGLLYEVNGQKPYTGKVFDLYKSNGNKKVEGYYRKGIKNGKWTYYTEIGNGKYKVKYTDGTYTVAVFTDSLGNDYTGLPITDEPEQDGIYLFQEEDKYDFSKFSNIFATIKDGEPDGLFIYWYENGRKRSEETYKDGKEDGLWTSWYENGQKSEEGTYKDGKEDGLWTSWYENGQKRGEWTYKDGKKEGFVTMMVTANVRAQLDPCG